MEKKPSLDGHHWWINIHMAISYICIYIYIWINMDIHNMYIYIYISISQYIAMMADGYNFSNCPYILPTHVQSCPLLCWRLAPHCGQRQQSIPQTHSTIQRLKFYLCACIYIYILLYCILVLYYYTYYI